jgi:MinD superfamily P-loop ATPase
MREVVVLSGKGGTGKTTIVGSFAALAQGKVLADCDVDAADLHLLLDPAIGSKNEFWSGQVARIDIEKCSKCGLCEDLCRFGAIRDLSIDPVSCEGCGLCCRACPDEAIRMEECLSGHWFVSETRYGPLVHARLGIAEENSGKLVALVKQAARSIATEHELKYVITDGPPGIGCPVISSLSGADLALLVTEPTLAGMHDLERVMGVCNHFGVPALVCINKCDINEDNAGRIEESCTRQGVEVVSKIPMDNVVTEALVRGLPVVEYSRNGVSEQIGQLWKTISRRLEPH